MVNVKKTVFITGTRLAWLMTVDVIYGESLDESVIWKISRKGGYCEGSNNGYIQ